MQVPKGASRLPAGHLEGSMRTREFGIPLVALGLVGATSCDPKGEEDDDDYSDIPILGSNGTGYDGGDGGDGGDGTFDGEDTLLGAWSLTEVEGVPWSYGYSYTYGGCTVTYAFSIVFDFDEEVGESGFSGVLSQAYTYTFEGDCARESYSYGEEYGATGERFSARRYGIQATSLGLRFDCELAEGDLDDMNCTYAGLSYRWQR